MKAAVRDYVKVRARARARAPARMHPPRKPARTPRPPACPVARAAPTRRARTRNPVVAPSRRQRRRRRPRMWGRAWWMSTTCWMTPVGAPGERGGVSRGRRGDRGGTHFSCTRGLGSARSAAPKVECTRWLLACEQHSGRPATPARQGDDAPSLSPPGARAELERLHADRIAAMKQEAERRAELERQGHGTYEDVSEGDFLEVRRATGAADGGQGTRGAGLTAEAAGAGEQCLAGCAAAPSGGAHERLPPAGPAQIQRRKPGGPCPSPRTAPCHSPAGNDVHRKRGGALLPPRL